MFHQIPGQNRIFMGWYSQGTQVVDFVENPETGTVEFFPVGYMIPASANQWASAVFKVERTPTERSPTTGATGDFSLGIAGRSAIDVWKATLPAPRQFAAGRDRPGHRAGRQRACEGCADDTVTVTITYENRRTKPMTNVVLFDAFADAVQICVRLDGGARRTARRSLEPGTLAPGPAGRRP